MPISGTSCLFVILICYRLKLHNLTNLESYVNEHYTWRYTKRETIIQIPGG